MNLRLLIASSVVVFLPGCAAWDAYFMAKYDNIEYTMVNRIRTLSETSVNSCKDQVVSKAVFEQLNMMGLELKNFTQYIPNNDDTYKIADNIHELTKQGWEMYEKSNSVSQRFCELKLQQINRTAETAQKVIGSKPR